MFLWQLKTEGKIPEKEKRRAVAAAATNLWRESWLAWLANLANNEKHGSGRHVWRQYAWCVKGEGLLFKTGLKF